jgi:RNA polymerase sigma-70 factor (ECF subfamily)
MWETSRDLASGPALDVGRAVRYDDPVTAGPAGESAQAAAFRRLAEQHLRSSHRLATAILGDAIAAEDAVHDAFERAWRTWSSLREVELFEAWFRRILVNVCRDSLRRRQRWPSHSLTDEMPLYAPDRFDAVLDRDELARGLARLRPDEQILLALRFTEDLKVDDIAAALVIPSGTVMSRLHHAIRRLREAMAAGQPGGAR